MIERFDPAEPIQSGEQGLRSDWNLMYRLAAQHDYIAKLHGRLALVAWSLIVIGLMLLTASFLVPGDGGVLFNVLPVIAFSAGLGPSLTASALGRHLKALRMDMDNLRHRIRLRGVDL